jgi:hypothetical protein
LIPSQPIHITKVDEKRGDLTMPHHDKEKPQPISVQDASEATVDTEPIELTKEELEEAAEGLSESDIVKDAAK